MFRCFFGSAWGLGWPSLDRYINTKNYSSVVVILSLESALLWAATRFCCPTCFNLFVVRSSISSQYVWHVFFLVLHSSSSSSSALSDGNCINNNAAAAEYKCWHRILFCFEFRHQSSALLRTCVGTTYEMGAIVISRPHNKSASTYHFYVRWSWNRVNFKICASAQEPWVKTCP